MTPVEHLSIVDSDLLWIERTVDNHAVIVRAAGEVDLASAPLLSEQLRLAEAVAVPPAPVVLDLVGVTFFGSAGLSVLLDHNERCAQLGIRLQVIGSWTVNRVVVATGLADMLAVVPAEAPGPDEGGRAADVRLP